MRAAPGTLLQDLLKLDQSGPWVELLAFSLPYGRTLRVANNTEPVTYSGEVYKAVSFEPHVGALNKGAKMPQFSLRLNNMSPDLAGWLRRAGGLEGQTLTIAIVCTDHLELDYTEFTTTYDIRGHDDGDDWITFELGGPNCYLHRYPYRRYLANLCELTFKGALCGYTGTAQSCAYSLTACRALGNGTRYGGTPGLRAQTVRVV